MFLIFIFTMLLRLSLWNSKIDEIYSLCRNPAYQCHFKNKNPSVLEDRFYQQEIPRLVIKNETVKNLEQNTLFFRLKNRVYRWLDEHSEPLKPLVHSVWQADLNFMPTWFIDQYLRMGLLPILALSAGHVFVLTGLIKFLIHQVPYLNRFIYYRYLIRFLPLACSVLLFILSNHSPSMLRTTMMILSLLLLKMRNMHCTPLQLVCSSSAILFFIQPNLICERGFLLSMVATGFLCFLTMTDKTFTSFLSSSFFLPILMFPMTSLLFSKVSILSPLFGIGFNLIWSLIWIPLGFIWPFIHSILPHKITLWLSPFLEKFWEKFVDLHRFGEHLFSVQYKTIYRPSWYEWIFLEGLLAMLYYYLFLRNHLCKTNDLK